MGIDCVFVHAGYPLWLVSLFRDTKTRTSLSLAAARLTASDRLQSLTTGVHHHQKIVKLLRF
jgi:hypothetical protein